jgi:hypothetical protein
MGKNKIFFYTINNISFLLKWNCTFFFIQIKFIDKNFFCINFNNFLIQKIMLKNFNKKNYIKFIFFNKNIKYFIGIFNFAGFNKLFLKGLIFFNYLIFKNNFDNNLEKFKDKSSFSYNIKLCVENYKRIINLYINLFIDNFFYITFCVSTHKS